MTIYFLSTSRPDTSYQVSSQLVQEKEFKIDFQDGGHGDHLGFPIGTILDIFNLLIVPMPKLRVKSIYSTGWELLKMWKADERTDDGQQATAYADLDQNSRWAYNTRNVLH